jgi:hypothetical protein
MQVKCYATSHEPVDVNSRDAILSGHCGLCTAHVSARLRLVLFREQYHQLQLYRADVIIPLGLASMFVQAFILKKRDAIATGQRNRSVSARRDLPDSKRQPERRFATMSRLLAFDRSLRCD